MQSGRVSRSWSEGRGGPGEHADGPRPLPSKRGKLFGPVPGFDTEPLGTQAESVLPGSRGRGATSLMVLADGGEAFKAAHSVAGMPRRGGDADRSRHGRFLLRGDSHARSQRITRAARPPRDGLIVFRRGEDYGMEMGPVKDGLMGEHRGVDYDAPRDDG